MLPTIVTTNLSGKAIREKYGDRLADRFNEMMQVVTMPDINFRNP
jgi:DNA replication protein DnaC